MRYKTLGLALIVSSFAPSEGQAQAGDIQAGQAAEKAQVQKTDAATQDLATQDRVAELEAQLKSANDHFYKSFREAKTKEARTKVLTTLRPNPKTFIDKAWKIVSSAPKSSGAAAALSFICRTDRSIVGRERAYDALRADHLGAPEMPAVVKTVNKRMFSASAEKFVRAYIKTLSDPEALGLAHFSLAGCLQGMTSFRRSNKTLADVKPSHLKYYGEASVKAFLLRNADELEKEAIACYTKVIKEEGYGASKHYKGTLADAAVSELFELQNLAIGKAAPDIVGEDIGGTQFKLSDYRGKVILLDFWGDW